MVAVSKMNLDGVILDAAGSLFARHGFEQTSIQSIADAVDLSKAGLLHHYPNKRALYEAVLDQCEGEIGRIRERLAGAEERAERDRSAIRLLVDLALIRPGLVALLLASATPHFEGIGPSDLATMRVVLFRCFDDAVPAVHRTIRVTGALAALGVLSLAAVRADETSAWRDAIIDTSFDALGRRGDSRPGASS